jgi:hypothetical protein
MSTIETITKSRPKIDKVTISSGDLWIMGMNGAQRHQLVLRNVKEPNNPYSDAEIAAMVLCEFDGTKCFTDQNAGVPACMAMDAGDLRKIAVRALTISDISTTPKEQDEIEKKS